MTSPEVPPSRRFLGKRASLFERTEVYVRPEGFEIEERSLVSLRRTWALFDDVVLVTLHPARAWSGASVAAFFALTFGATGSLFFFAGPDSRLAAWVSLTFAVLMLLMAAASLAFPRWTVTIQGRRSRAAMGSMSRSRNQALYDETVRCVVESRWGVPSPVAADHSGTGPEEAHQDFPAESG